MPNNQLSPLRNNYNSQGPTGIPLRTQSTPLNELSQATQSYVVEQGTCLPTSARIPVGQKFPANVQVVHMVGGNPQAMNQQSNTSVVRMGDSQQSRTSVVRMGDSQQSNCVNFSVPSSSNGGFGRSLNEQIPKVTRSTDSLRINPDDQSQSSLQQRQIKSLSDGTTINLNPK